MKHPGIQIRKDCIERNGLTVTEAAHGARSQAQDEERRHDHQDQTAL
ncbi:MAG: hypothetical protein OXC62_01990 [Aestuariivita sp.]|nr:hypothetical protein [Aestuariivita sp.]